MSFLQDSAVLLCDCCIDLLMDNNGGIITVSEPHHATLGSPRKHITCCVIILSLYYVFVTLCLAALLFSNKTGLENIEAFLQLLKMLAQKFFLYVFKLAYVL